MISAMGEMPDESINEFKLSGKMDVHLQIEILTEQMKLASSELRFEDAAALRDRIKYLQNKNGL